MVYASGTVMTSNPRSRRKEERRASAVVFPPHGPPVNTNLWKGADFVRRFVSAWVRLLRVPFVVLDEVVVEVVRAAISLLRVSSIDWERHLRDWTSDSRRGKAVMSSSLLLLVFLLSFMVIVICIVYCIVICIRL